MTLLDAKPPKPSPKIGRYIVIAVALLVIGIVAYVAMRNHPEEEAVSQFLNALEQAKFRDAYQLWQPSSTYSFDDFMHDWGEHGDYGKIRDYRILGSQAKGKSSVIVVVTINDVTPPAEILVDRKTKGLAFSPY